MDIIISHTAALRFWQRFPGRRRALRPSPSVTACTQRVRLTADLREELAKLGIPCSAATPTDVLFAEQSLRARTPAIRSHVETRNLPPASFLRVSPHVLIVCPELCFVQMSASLSVEELAAVACAFAGTYAVSVNGPLLSREPITSREGIAAYLDVLPPDSLNRQTARARRALALSFDNAASPMEAKLALLLTLPTSLGGYGLPRPELNAALELSPEARALYAHASYRPDLYWREARLAVEYDGLAFHEGDAAHAKDLARLAAMRAENLDVHVLSYPQIADASAFSTVAQTLSQRLHHRLRIRRQDFAARNARLRERLEVA